MSIHTLVINCLLHNPDTFPHQPVRSSATEAFKADPSSHKVMQYLIHSILMCWDTIQRPGNIWDSTMYIHCPTDQPPQQQQSQSKRHLDHDDSEGPSGESDGPFGNTSRHCRVTTSLPATGRYQPSAYADDESKDHPPRKNRRTSTPANTTPMDKAGFQPFPRQMTRMNHRPPHPGQNTHGVLWRRK